MNTVEQLNAILSVLETIEVKGSKNLNYLLYAIQQANALKEAAQNAEKQTN